MRKERHRLVNLPQDTQPISDRAQVFALNPYMIAAWITTLLYV